MARYLLARITAAVITVLAVTVAVAMLIHIVPGDPVRIMFAQSQGTTPEQLEAIRSRLGLDLPIWEQYLLYMSRILQGDFGHTIRGNQPVLELLLERLPNTLYLATVSLLIAMAIRLPTGRYRVLYRALGQPDWVETHAMTNPGGRYTITKNDYASRGDLVVTVSGAWGLVSVDGGTARETPYKFTGLAVGPHVVQISREGFQTIVDTVMVAPTGTTTRQYTLRR
jgi:hypothetical protein